MAIFLFEFKGRYCEGETILSDKYIGERTPTNPKPFE